MIHQLTLGHELTGYHEKHDGQTNVIRYRAGNRVLRNLHPAECRIRTHKKRNGRSRKQNGQYNRQGQYNDATEENNKEYCGHYLLPPFPEVANL